MKKIIKFLLILLIPLLGIAAYILYTQPILLNINPFFTTKYITRHNGEEEVSEYLRKDIVPQVKAELPEGWSIRTIGIRMYPKDPYLEAESVVKGLVEISIYKEDEEVSHITNTPLGYGFPMISFYKFPDYDPDLYEEFLQSTNPDDMKYFQEVNEGEYTEIEIYESQIRRVDSTYILNDSDNPDKYFGSIFALQTFSFNHPAFEYCYYYDVDYKEKIEEACMDGYFMYADQDLTEEDLLVIDSILGSMEVRN